MNFPYHITPYQFVIWRSDSNSMVNTLTNMPYIIRYILPCLKLKCFKALVLANWWQFAPSEVLPMIALQVVYLGNEVCCYSKTYKSLLRTKEPVYLYAFYLASCINMQCLFALCGLKSKSALTFNLVLLFLFTFTLYLFFHLSHTQFSPVAELGLNITNSAC